MLRLSLLLLLLLLLLLSSSSSSSSLLGWVESPGYPGGYPPHAHLNWSRCAPAGHLLTLRLLHLDLEDSLDCDNDALKVYSEEVLLSVLCGSLSLEELDSSVNPSLLSSAGGCLSLSFSSDYSNTHRHTGFRGFYTLTDFDECEDASCTHFCHNVVGGYHCSCRRGYQLAADKHTCEVSCNEDLSGLTQGVVASPSWPAPYPENSHCEVRLSVDDHLQLELNFSPSFDVETSPDGRCSDALTVQTPSRTFGPFCGSAPPPSPLHTHSHQASILFTSDGSGTNKGFTLRFRTKGKVCRGPVAAHTSVTPQEAEYEGGRTVTVSCELGFVAQPPGLRTLLTQYESTCLSSGLWSPSDACQPVNCGRPQLPRDGVLQLAGQQSEYRDQVRFSCSSEFYRLEGDDTFTCNATGEWASASGRSRMPRCTAVCGEPSQSSWSPGRVLGGRDAELGQIPWQLLIRRPRGGATLISDRWALTAAHVVERLNGASLTLYGGLVDASPFKSVATKLTSERVVLHPDYSPQNAARYDNDIALVRLSSRVPLSRYLLPVCLPDSGAGVQEKDMGTVSGWGMTEIHNKSRMLKFADIGVYANERCSHAPTAAPGRSVGFTSNMFCGGAPGVDACKGDSGGPVVVPPLSQGTGPYRLAGIVSWGEYCRNQGNKGYYTRVEKYRDWITNTIEEVEGRG